MGTCEISITLGKEILHESHELSIKMGKKSKMSNHAFSIKLGKEILHEYS